MENNKKIISINNFKIIKELGRGMNGTVFLVEYHKKYYALKINKILPENVKYNIKSDTWREINFSIKFANKYPDQFMKLYFYDIIDNCKHEQKYLVNAVKLQKSNYCIRKIYSLIDDELKNVINDLDKKQIYSMIVQLTYCIYLMNTNKYVHADLHSKNIGIIKTDKKIKIFDKSICTFGYQFIIIDYGSTLHPNFLLNYHELQKYNYYLKNEINTIMIQIITYDKDSDVYKLVTANYKKNNNINVYTNFLKSDEYKLLKNYASTDEDRFYLYQIMFPGSFQKEYLEHLGVKFIKTHMPILKIDLEDILYFFKNKNDLKKIINYFSNKI